MKKILIILLISIVIINIILDRNAKYNFKNEHFPPNIMSDLDESISLPDTEEGIEIPKNIYRCYKDNEGIKKFQKVFDLTNERLPGYKQIYFTDDDIDNYIKDNFSERIYTAYNNINPKYGAAKADFFRYLVIYKEGGIYLDIKSGPTKNISGFFEKYNNKLLVGTGLNIVRYLFPIEHFRGIFDINDDWNYITKINGSEYQQYVIAGNKGNPLMKKVIQQVVSNIEYGMENKKYYNSGNFSVVAMTGPITYTLVLEKYKRKYKENIAFFNGGLSGRISHSLIDYKKIMSNEHYSKIKNKQILV